MPRYVGWCMENRLDVVSIVKGFGRECDLIDIGIPSRNVIRVRIACGVKWNARRVRSCYCVNK